MTVTLPAEPRVWRGLALVFVLLTLLFALAFYLWRLSIVIVLGLGVNVILDRLIADYRSRLERFGVTGLARRLYGALLVAFWIGGAWVLVWSSAEDLAPALARLAGTADTGFAAYAEAAAPYLPRPLRGMLLGERALEAYRGQLDAVRAALVANAPALVLDAALVIPLIVYAHYRARRTLAGAIEEAAPEPYREGLGRAARAIESALRGFFAAKVVQSTIVGGLCCLGFFVGGVPGWLLLGALAGALNVVPYLGPLLGAVPPVALSLLVGDPTAAAIAAVTLAIARIVDDVYLTPFLIAHRVRMDPLLNLLLILGGLQLLGVLGMVFAVPVYMIYEIVLRETRAQLERGVRAGA